MAQKKPEPNRRAAAVAHKAEPENLDDTPVEIPVDAQKGKSIEEQIQEQIRIQLAKKLGGQEAS